MDVSKPFDTVPHQKLLYKLSIKDPLHQWLTKFQNKRQMRVILEGNASKEVPFISCVPQGTVLGLFLFLYHVNDLPQGIESCVQLFADGCLIYHEIKADEDHKLLLKDVDAPEGWASEWGNALLMQRIAT